MTEKEIKERLEYLREEIHAERISYGEIAELQSLARHIAPDDVELLEWAGAPESLGDCEECETGKAEMGSLCFECAKIAKN